VWVSRGVWTMITKKFIAGHIFLDNNKKFQPSPRNNKDMAVLTDTYLFLTCVWFNSLFCLISCGLTFIMTFCPLRYEKYNSSKNSYFTRLGGRRGRCDWITFRPWRSHHQRAGLLTDGNHNKVQHRLASARGSLQHTPTCLGGSRIGGPALLQPPGPCLSLSSPTTNR
jgi:hypothetical protein